MFPIQREARTESTAVHLIQIQEGQSSLSKDPYLHASTYASD